MILHRCVSAIFQFCQVAPGELQVYTIRALYTLYTCTYIVYICTLTLYTYTYNVYIHLHCIHILTLYTYAYILYIHLQLYTTRALFSPNNFLETFPSGQLQHLSAHVQSCGVSSRTQQPKTFADIAATFVSSHSQSTAGLLINNIPQLLLQVQVQVRPNILLLPISQ